MNALVSSQSPVEIDAGPTFEHTHAWLPLGLKHVGMLLVILIEPHGLDPLSPHPLHTTHYTLHTEDQDMT